MTSQIFWSLACLAVLKSEANALRCGFLESKSTPRLPLTGWVYLWTFTLPEEASQIVLLQSTWLAWGKNLRRDIPHWRGFRAFEKSPAGRWHVHAVTVERFNVSMIRSHAMKYGFGRTNVRRIPASKAGYVAKYLAKQKRLPEAKGVRLAGPFGFKGVSFSDIVTKDTWRDYILKHTHVAEGQFYPWIHRDKAARSVWLESLGPSNLSKTSNKMKIEKKEHMQQVIDSLQAGEAIMIGEYRGHRVDVKMMSVKERPEIKETRIIVAHSFESAVGEQIICAEWTPPGTRPEDIKIKMQKGEICILVLQGLQFKGGSRQATPKRFELLSKLLATA